MFNRKKKNPIVEETERKAEIMEYVMLENQKKRKDEDRVISYIEDKKGEFNNAREPIFHAKLNLMTVEELQVLNFKCLDAMVSYYRSLGKHLAGEELNIGQRTLGIMIGDLSKAMEHIVSSATGEKIEGSLLEVIQFLYVYEKLQQSYLAVDFYSIKHVFPQELFQKNEENKETWIA